MSEINSSNFKKEHGDLAPDLVGVTELTSPYFFVPPSGTTAERPSDCEPGTLRFNTDHGSLEIFRGDTIGWEQILRLDNQYLGDGTTGVGTRIITGGGYKTPDSSNNNTIEYNTMETLSNSLDFGDLTNINAQMGAMSDHTRLIFVGGSQPGHKDVLQFITISSTGDATDFGDVTSGQATNAYAGAAKTRGVFHAGNTPSQNNTLEYVTLQTLGNSVDFGDLVEQSSHRTGNVASTTRGLLMGNYSPTSSEGDYYLRDLDIDFFTFATLGNALDFGDLTSVVAGSWNSSNSTRAVRYGKWPTNPSCDYVTIATLGNAIDFGDLSRSSYDHSGGASKTRILRCGGNGPDNAPVYNQNTIDYIEIATTGNFVDFGDMTQAIRNTASNTSNHGGVA